MTDTVKLIIEISKETVKEIKDNAMFAKDIADDIKWDVTSAIVNGTPLDSIKADVINIADGRQSIKVRSVLRILDRIGKAESEG